MEGGGGGCVAVEDGLVHGGAEILEETGPVAVGGGELGEDGELFGGEVPSEEVGEGGWDGEEDLVAGEELDAVWGGDEELGSVVMVAVGRDDGGFEENIGGTKVLGSLV